jgi:TetR/AcrR family transcriptional repressor of nem operon
MTQSNAKDKLIEASYELMLSKGYAATSVDDLCHKAGVSKGSFYHFFGTKEDLGLALLDDFFAKSKDRFLNGAFVSETDPIRKLFTFLRQTEESAETLWSRGCLLGNFATELSQSHPVVRQKVSMILKRVTGNIAAIFRPVGAMHPKEELLQADHLAELYVAIIEGAIILSRAHDDWSYLHRALLSFRAYLESIID